MMNCRNSWALLKWTETGIGGKDRNRHWDKKSAQLRKKADPDSFEKVGFNKVGVIGAISRKGNVVCKVVGSTDAPTLDSPVRRVTDKLVGWSDR